MIRSQPIEILGQDGRDKLQIVQILAEIDRIISRTEAAEFELVSPTGALEKQRKATGSFYTPSDVAAHFWDLFFRHHRITSAAAFDSLVSKSDFVEPSAGSGIFVLSFIRKALLLGVSAAKLSRMNFHVVDVNPVALRYFANSLAEFEILLSVRFSGVRLYQEDFLKWIVSKTFKSVIYVGNPPFVANPRGARWRNLFADFLEATLNSDTRFLSVSLILPLSICFSRDYRALRERILSLDLGVSTSSYDNIPDCLFRSGKPESLNSNRANSQRCTILNIGGPPKREATALLRWSTSERKTFLSQLPTFIDYDRKMYGGQIPRPVSSQIIQYIRAASSNESIGSLLSKSAAKKFVVTSVARNFIGIREFDSGEDRGIIIGPSSDEAFYVLIQIICSPIFYNYWRSLGDGFHLTVDLIEGFPISKAMLQTCVANLEKAENIWGHRRFFSKSKLNSGKVVESFDFTEAFKYLGNDLC